jgi:hypothetical protein
MMKIFASYVFIGVLMLQAACSEMAFYEGLRTEQQRASDMNRSKANPLPPFDKYQKERGAMQPASP